MTLFHYLSIVCMGICGSFLLASQLSLDENCRWKKLAVFMAIMTVNRRIAICLRKIVGNCFIGDFIIKNRIF